MNLDDIRTRVLENLDDPDGDVFTENRIDRSINDALQELYVLSARVDQSFGTLSPADGSNFLIEITGVGTTVKGEFGVESDLPADFHRLISVYRESPTPTGHVMIVPQPQAVIYESIDPGEVAYVRHNMDGSEGGRTRIGFPNLTDSVDYKFSVLYHATHPVISSHSKIVQIQTEYHHLIVTGATVRLLLEENSDARPFQNLYQQGVQAMMMAIQDRGGAKVTV